MSVQPGRSAWTLAREREFSWISVRSVDCDQCYLITTTYAITKNYFRTSVHLCLWQTFAAAPELGLGHQFKQQREEFVSVSRSSSVIAPLHELTYFEATFLLQPPTHCPIRQLDNNSASARRSIVANWLGREQTILMGQVRKLARRPAASPTRAYLIP